MPSPSESLSNGLEPPKTSDRYGSEPAPIIDSIIRVKIDWIRSSLQLRHHQQSLVSSVDSENTIIIQWVRASSSKSSNTISSVGCSIVIRVTNSLSIVDRFQCLNQHSHHRANGSSSEIRFEVQSSSSYKIANHHRRLLMPSSSESLSNDLIGVCHRSTRLHR